MIGNAKGVDYDLVEVKVPLICLGTAGVSARRDGRYASWCNDRGGKSHNGLDHATNYIQFLR